MSWADDLIVDIEAQPSVERRCSCLLGGLRIQIAAITTRDPKTLEDLNALLGQLEADGNALVSAVVANHPVRVARDF